MAEGRERARQAKAQVLQTPTPITIPSPIAPTATQTLIVEPKKVEQTSTPIVEPKKEENAKEETDYTWWILGGLVAAITLGTVILRKK